MCNGVFLWSAGWRDRQRAHGEVTAPTPLSLWKPIRDLWAVKKPLQPNGLNIKQEIKQTVELSEEAAEHHRGRVSLTEE